MIEGAPLFIRTSEDEEALEPTRLRESLDRMFAAGMSWSQADTIIANFHYRRYIRLTGDDPWLPQRFRNIRMRRFWRDHQPTPPMKEAVWRPSRTHV